MYMYTREQKRLLIDLINEANPGLNLSPLALDTARLGVPWSRTPGPGEIADTSVEVFPRDNTFFIGKVIVHYRRLDVAKLFAHKVLNFDRWREGNVTTDDLVKWINERYQTQFVIEDLGTGNWPTWIGVRTWNIKPESLCYQGTLSFRWDKGKRELNQIIQTNDFEGRIWDERHGGALDERPLLMFTGYGGDFSDYKSNINQLSNGRVIDGTEGNLRVIFKRYNELYETELSIDIDHTQQNGLKGLTITRVSLPSTLVPEANPERFGAAMVITSQEDSWFGGRMILHYSRLFQLYESTMMVGDETSGFYEEIDAASFITPGDFKSLIGLNVGTLIYPDSSWLSLEFGGKKFITTKMSMVNNISWDDLNARNLIFGSDSTIIEIRGTRYRVRSFSGSTSKDHTFDVDQRSVYEEPFVNSEFNQTLMRLVDDWSLYSAAEVGIDGSVPSGRLIWCQESVSYNGNANLVRSYYGAFKPPSSYRSTAHGWRPVLEVVTE